MNPQQEIVDLKNVMVSSHDDAQVSQSPSTFSDDGSAESTLRNVNESNNKDDELQLREEKFAFRDVLLKRMLLGKDIAFTEMVLRHEALIRDEAIRCHEDEQKQKIGEDIDGVDNEIVSNASTFNRALHFEIGLAVPGFLAVFFFCIVHLAAYLLVESVLEESTRACSNEDTVYVVTFFASVLLLRLTGGICEWLSPTRCAAAEIEFQRRIRVGCWDSRLYLWFQQHRRVKLFLDYLAFYVCFVGIAQFHHRLFSPIFEDRAWILDKLPSRQHNLETTVAMSLKGRLTPTCPVEEDQLCSLLDELTRQDVEYLFSQVSYSSYLAIMGNAAAHAATPFAIRVFSLCLISFGILALHALEYHQL